MWIFSGGVHTFHILSSLDSFYLGLKVTVECSDQSVYKNEEFQWLVHREHTILLSREKVNKGMKNNEQFAFVSLSSLLSYAILLGKPLLTNPA